MLLLQYRMCVKYWFFYGLQLAIMCTWLGNTVGCLSNCIPLSELWCLLQKVIFFRDKWCCACLHRPFVYLCIVCLMHEVFVKYPFCLSKKLPGSTGVDVARGKCIVLYVNCGVLYGEYCLKAMMCAPVMWHNILNVNTEIFVGG